MPKSGSSSPCQLSAEEPLTQGRCSDSSTASNGTFVPTVTAIATAPALKWMVLSTDISSVGPCSGEKTKKAPVSKKKTLSPQKKTHMPKSKTQPETGTGAAGGRRKAPKEQLSPEEEERRRVRRERNKLAAAKCRNRRRQLTDSLQAETDSLEMEKAALEAEISSLVKQKEQLELILTSHKPQCKVPAEMDEENEKKQEEKKEKEEKTVPEDPPVKKLPADTKALHSSPVKNPSSPAPLHEEPMISGDSDLLLCSSASLEPYNDFKDVAMEELESKMEYNDDDDMDLLVPDIDLSASLGLTEWETLYMTMGGSLEPLMFDLEECEGGKVKPGFVNSNLITL